MAPFDHFDFLAPYYDRIMQPIDLAHFSQVAGLPVPGYILDVAGGTGEKSSQMLKMSGGVIIADLSMGMLHQARKKGGVVPVRSQAERLPFDDETFERVMMVDALHHMIDYRAALSEMWRLVKPGGRIVIEEPDVGTMAGKLMAIFEKMILMRSHFIDPQRITASFKDPHARTHIESEGVTAWIVVDKPAG